MERAIEKNLMIRVIIAGFAVAIFSALYCWGGFEFKWLRRFIGAAVWILAACILSGDWRNLIRYPIMCLGLSLGYGADHFWMKVLMRLKCAVVAAPAMCVCRKPQPALIFLAIAIIVPVVLGSTNPFNSLPGGARLEEFCIGMAYGLQLLPLAADTKA